MQAAKRKKPGKALERVAREIKDADDFVEHVAALAQRYKDEHALEGSAVRQSLKAFRKHAEALAEWLEQASKVNRASGERDALEKIGTLMYGVPHHAQAADQSVREWLAQAGKAADRCLNDAKLLPRKAANAAARVAAEGLRATFEHHKLKLSAQVSKTQQSDAVRLLCAIAKNAGDAQLSAMDAKQALVESGKRKSGE